MLQRAPCHHLDKTKLAQSQNGSMWRKIRRYEQQHKALQTCAQPMLAL